MRFDAFMRSALYDPERGYYRGKRDPFGAEGDFYTAAQVQPLFGRVIAAEIETLAPGEPVFELGPGRREMAEALGTKYTGIDIEDQLPARLDGVVFANEFFDALPVRLVLNEAGEFHEGMVEDGEIRSGPVLDAESLGYVRRYWPRVPDGGRLEIACEALDWIRRLAGRMRRGIALFIDYGYTTAETIRFPRGTLMSYRRHIALDSVLTRPGEQDITAHVPFDAMIDHAVECGFRFVRMETLASLVLRNVERNSGLVTSLQDRQQLKTLLFGMGETFRCVLLEKRT